MKRSVLLGLAGIALCTACFIDTTTLSGGDDGDPSDGAGGPSHEGAGGPGSGGGITNGGSGGDTTSASGGAGASSSSGDGGSGAEAPGCYYERHDSGASLDDLRNGYDPNAWLEILLAVLNRRYDNGFFVLDAMKDDPWLQSDFPSYFDLGSWPGLMDAVDTACHEETHGYDFDQSLSLPGQHLYFLGQGQEVAAPELAFFARSEIIPLVEAGGSVTGLYDDTYLTGRQGSYDFIFLADELTAYINGLACATSVADELPFTASYRDGAAAHLLYLELYLQVARTNHPSLYDAWKADPAWQKFVRLSWARGRYWLGEASGNPNLGIDDAAILARVDSPDNVAEIAAFTSADPADVACHP